MRPVQVPLLATLAVLLFAGGTAHGATDHIGWMLVCGMGLLLGLGVYANARRNDLR